MEVEFGRVPAEELDSARKDMARPGAAKGRSHRSV
jgi:hypothetical protein